MIPRREFIRRISAAGVLGVTGAAVIANRSIAKGDDDVELIDTDRLPPPFTRPFERLPVLARSGQERDAEGRLRDVYTVTARPTTVSWVPGIATTVFGYNGLVPGPTIRARRNQPLRLRVINRLPAVNPIGLFPDTVRGDHHTIQRNPDIESDELEPGFKLATHLHGAPSPPYYDGYPNDLIPPNYYKDYIYNNEESVRTLWYHDHEFFKTTQNLYSGLAGLYELTSAEDEALLPQGEFDVSLMVKDVQIGQNGRLAFDDDGHDGVWGNVITVNGVPWPTMSVKPRVYRFRVLNASTARSYGFRLSNNDPVTFVSGDGGYMIRPTPANFWRHATAERYGFLIDFSKYRPGTRIQLLNQSPDNNEDFEHTDKVMEFVVEGTNDFSRANNTIPSSLPTEDVMRLTPADAVRKRLFRFERQGGEWTINGSTWHDVIESNFEAVLANPGVGDTEIWTIDNRSGGWAHPVHLHLVDFKILHRNGKAPFSYEKSPKDTVFLNGNEVVDVIMRFNGEGKYVFHCHNASHEDHDMMHQFRVGPRRNPDPRSPFKVPARPIGS